MGHWNRTTNAEVSGGAEVSGEKLEFEDLSAAILGCALTVQRALGPGLLESTYQVCFIHELRKHGLKVLSEVSVDLTYDDLIIEKAYRLDLLIEDAIVIELKTVDRLTDTHSAQLFTYLRFAKKRLGILINFWAWPLKDGGIKRVLNSQV